MTPKGKWCAIHIKTYGLSARKCYDTAFYRIDTQYTKQGMYEFCIYQNDNHDDSGIEVCMSKKQLEDLRDYITNKLEEN